MFQTIVRLAVFSLLCRVVHCILIRAPTSTSLVHGLQLQLNCTTSLTGVPVAWRYKSEQSPTDVLIFFANTTLTQFRAQFDVVRDTDQYDLIGTQPANSNFTYCGAYTCSENNGGGPTSPTADVSFGGLPTCTSDVNTAGPNDIVQFTCAVPTCGAANPQLSFAINGSALSYVTNNRTTVAKNGSEVVGAEVSCTVSYGTLGSFKANCTQITPPSATTQTTTTSPPLTTTSSSGQCPPMNSSATGRATDSAVGSDPVKWAWKQAAIALSCTGFIFTIFCIAILIYERVKNPDGGMFCISITSCVGNFVVATGLFIGSAVCLAIYDGEKYPYVCLPYKDWLTGTLVIHAVMTAVTIVNIVIAVVHKFQGLSSGVMFFIAIIYVIVDCLSCATTIAWTVVVGEKINDYRNTDKWTWQVMLIVLGISVALAVVAIVLWLLEGGKCNKVCAR